MREVRVHAPPIFSALTTKNTGVVVASVVVCVAVVAALAVVVAVVLKKRLIPRGKLYMDSVSVCYF